MPEFKGKIRLPDGDSLKTTLTVDSGRMLAKAGEHEIGNWAIGELSAKRRNNEFLIKVEGEELVVDVADPIGLAEVLGVKEEESKQRRGKKPRIPRRKRRERLAKEAATPPVTAPAAEIPAPVAPEPAPVAPVVEDVPDPFFAAESVPVVEDVPDPFFAAESVPVVEDVPDPFFAVEPVPVVEDVPDPFFAVESVPVVEDVPDPFFATEPVPVVQEVPEPLLASAPVFVPEPVPVFAPEPAPAAAPVAAPVVAAEETDDGPSLWARTSKRTKLIGLGVIGFAVFFFAAPNLLAMVMMLAGVATLFLAIAAKNESGSGFMPPPFFATNAAIAGGFGSVLLAMVIMVIT